MQNTRKILVCIPAYNVAREIGKLVSDCCKFSYDVLVCDDGSADGTGRVAKENGAIVITHPKNLGKGSAMKSLFNSARDLDADVLVTMDGDGQFLPQEIDKIVKPIIEGKTDIVIGYRFDETNEIPKYRKFGNKVMDKLTTMASESSFTDTQSGFRAYSIKAIEQINFQAEGFAADSEILIDASRKGLRIAYEPITVLYDTGGQTSTRNPISHSKDVIGSLLELIALRRPLLYLGLPGLIMAVIGSGISMKVISIFNHTRYFSIPLTLLGIGAVLIGIMLILMSVVLFAIGRAMRRSS